VAARSYLVIGGGIVGAASALRLRAAGYNVTLVDPGDVKRGASYGNIGHIAAEQAMPLASPRTLMTFPSRLFSWGGPLAFRDGDFKLWAPWALRFMRYCTPFHFAQGAMALDTLQRESMAAWQRMFATAGVPSLIRPCGHYVVWMTDKVAQKARKAWRRAATGPAKFRDMNTDELARVGSAMKKAPVAGIAFTGTGQVSDPQAVRDALLFAFEGRGGVCVKGTVSAISSGAEAATALLESGETLKADAVLIAAGAWSRALIRGLGLDVPLIGERGYSLQSSVANWPPDLPPVVFEERALVVTRFTGGLRCSSFVEFGDPDGPPDLRKWERLQQHLNELGIDFSPSPERWCGPRPTLPDYLPAIGRMESHPRVLYAFGHQHLGMTLAGVTAELIESLANWKPPRMNIAPFRLERFA
jgi:D-amino-acid dehydrogenase